MAFKRVIIRRVGPLSWLLGIYILKKLLTKHRMVSVALFSLLAITLACFLAIQISFITSGILLLLLVLYGLYISYNSGALSASDESGWFNDTKQISKLVFVGRRVTVNNFIVFPALVFIATTFAKALWLSLYV